MLSKLLDPGKIALRGREPALGVRSVEGCEVRDKTRALDARIALVHAATSNLGTPPFCLMPTHPLHKREPALGCINDQGSRVSAASVPETT
jgi:hypothetical protein